jgi:hypothetical protein
MARTLLLASRRLLSMVVVAGMLVFLAPPLAHAGANAWTTRGPTGANVMAMVADGSTVWAGTTSGVYASVSGGAWTLMKGVDVLSLAAGGGVLYVGTNGGGVYRGPAGEHEWLAFNTGLGNTTVGALATDGNRLYAGTESGVYRYDGERWVAAGLAGVSIRGLVVGPEGLYAGTNAGVVVSPDRGDTWKATGLTGVSVRALLADGPVVYAATDSGVFRGSSAGSWTTLSTHAANALAMDPAGHIVYVGAGGGVVFQLTGAKTDLHLPVGLNVMALTLGRDHTLYAGTAGGGVFEYRPVVVDTTIASGPAALSTSPTATFTFTSTVAGSTFEASLDGRLWAAAVSPKTYTGLGDGPHSFAVRAMDPFGTVDSTPAVWTWTVQLAPAVTFQAPATLTGSVTVWFNRPVRWVTTQNLTLTESGSSLRLVSLLFRDAHGLPVSGLAGPVSSVVMTPAVALVPGQYYTATVNPSWAAAIRDFVTGTAVLTKAGQFRASTYEAEGSVAAQYRWTTVRAWKAMGGSFATDHLAGASASFTFEGPSVTWYTISGKRQGQAQVWIDGVYRTTVDNYSARRFNQVPRTFSGLSWSRHTITIVVTGQRSTQGWGTAVAVDGFGVNGTVAATPDVAFEWRAEREYGALGGWCTMSDRVGSSVSFRFRGTGISWLGMTGPDHGMANVFVDGVLRATVNDYSPTETYGVVHSIGGLTDSLHTIAIVAAGRAYGATGSLVVVDGFRVA